MTSPTSPRVLRLILVIGVIQACDITASEMPHATTPTSVVQLFDGVSLNAFETWLENHKTEDPHRVFSVVEYIDGGPAIRISGEHWGGLITKQRYRNYRLAAEFRWGVISWGTRKQRARDSGILLHCQGKPGNQRPDFSSPWMKSLEYQIIEGGTGDLIIVPGCEVVGGPRIFPSVVVRTGPPDGRTWSPKGSAVRIAQGRVNWFRRDPLWRDELGIRSVTDVEKPWGQWNRIEIVCFDDRLAYFLNGVLVNQVEASSLREGQILIQSEGAEIFFRQLELHPLSTADRELSVATSDSTRLPNAATRD